MAFRRLDFDRSGVDQSRQKASSDLPTAIASTTDPPESGAGGLAPWFARVAA